MSQEVRAIILLGSLLRDLASGSRGKVEQRRAWFTFTGNLLHYSYRRAAEDAMSRNDSRKEELQHQVRCHASIEALWMQEYRSHVLSSSFCEQLQTLNVLEAELRSLKPDAVS